MGDRLQNYKYQQCIDEIVNQRYSWHIANHSFTNRNCGYVIIFMIFDIHPSMLKLMASIFNYINSGSLLNPNSNLYWSSCVNLLNLSHWNINFVPLKYYEMCLSWPVDGLYVFNEGDTGFTVCHVLRCKSTCFHVVYCEMCVRPANEIRR